MATSVQIPIAEYLATYWKPDREYIDGEILERNVGTYEHGRVQGLFHWFFSHEAEWGIGVSLEWRARVSPTRVCIPDVTVVVAGPQSPVLVESPILAIEVLSPDYSYSDTQRRAQGYLNFGVNTIWMIDPSTLSGRICTGATWTAATRLEVPGTPIYVDLPTLFADLQPAGN